MRYSPIKKVDILNAGQQFDWATGDHYRLWFTGSTKRSKRIEVMIPRLVREDRLRRVRYGMGYVFAVPRISQGEYHIEHGLGCTEGLVRFWRSDMTGEIVPERFFRGSKCIPEWGVIYKETILLYEFSTTDQFSRGKKVEGKVVNYDINLHEIEEKFERTGIVVFVIDVPREKVERWVARVQPSGPYFFTDYESFKQVPIGQQLTAEIYLYGDGKVNPLRK